MRRRAYTHLGDRSHSNHAPRRRERTRLTLQPLSLKSVARSHNRQQLHSGVDRLQTPWNKRAFPSLAHRVTNQQHTKQASNKTDLCDPDTVHPHSDIRRTQTEKHTPRQRYGGKATNYETTQTTAHTRTHSSRKQIGKLHTQHQQITSTNPQTASPQQFTDETQRSRVHNLHAINRTTTHTRSSSRTRNSPLRA